MLFIDLKTILNSFITILTTCTSLRQDAQKTVDFSEP